MSADCWRLVAMYLPVTDQLSLRLLSKWHAWHAFAPSNNGVWFRLFRASCATHPWVHEVATNPEFQGDVVETLYAEAQPLVPPHARRLDYWNSSLDPIMEALDDDDMGAEVWPHCRQLQWCAMGEDPDPDDPRVQHYVEELREDWDDPQDYVANWSYDASVAWFREAARDAHLHWCRVLWAQAMSVSPENWIEADGWCYCQLVGELNVDVDDATMAHAVRVELATMDQAPEDAEWFRPYSFRVGLVEVARESPQIQLDEAEAAKQAHADRQASEMLATVEASSLEQEATLDVLLDVVEERGLQWFFTVALLFSRMGHGAPHLACSDYRVLRVLRESAPGASVLSPPLYADLVRQLRMAALFAPKRVVSLFRNLFCLLCKFSVAELECVVDRVQERWPRTFSDAERSALSTSHVCQGSGWMAESWTSAYRCDVDVADAHDDALVEDDCQLHSGVHRMLARAGVVQAFPEACVEGVHALRAFVREVVEIASHDLDPGSEVSALDIQRGVALRQTAMQALQRLYPLHDSDDEPMTLVEWGADSEEASSAEEGDDGDNHDEGEPEEEYYGAYAYADGGLEDGDDPLVTALVQRAAEGDRSHSVLDPNGLTRWVHREAAFDAQGIVSETLLTLPESAPRTHAYSSAPEPYSSDEDFFHLPPPHDEYDEVEEWPSVVGAEAYRRSNDQVGATEGLHLRPH